MATSGTGNEEAARVIQKAIKSAARKRRADDRRAMRRVSDKDLIRECERRGLEVRRETVIGVERGP